MKTVAYAQRVDADFQKLGMMGKSVIIASGDTGAKSRQGFGFAPEFPAVLPSCTAVGATVLNANLTETQCVSCSFGWCSGGGFSFPEYFPNSTAPWQLAAISQYLSQQSILPPAKSWEKEKGGVGFPDVATVGTNHRICTFVVLCVLLI
jgi:tripeptidyl-peptidase-1